MRTFSIIGGALAVALSLAGSTASAQNLLVNPSFELPPLTPSSEAPGAGLGWNPYNGVFRQNFLPAHDSTHYVKTFGNGGMFQDVPVVPGQPFTASAWAQTSATDSAGTAVIGGQLLVIFRNAANNGDVGSTLVDVIVNEASARDVYQQGLITGTVPAGAGFIRFQLNQYAAAGGAVFFDDASLVIPEPATLSTLAVVGTLAARRRRR